MSYLAVPCYLFLLSPWTEKTREACSLHTENIFIQKPEATVKTDIYTTRFHTLFHWACVLYIQASIKSAPMLRIKLWNPN